MEIDQLEDVGTYDTETINEKDFYPWIVVLSTFLILMVGLGTGQSW